ncbi:DUF6170 family protein [Alteromonas sp. 14N.309.X.WAT.G.H12]|uniref:DUF6170 family protein n=1 Tax=Alteromonas sp. 14N.309.X.WAT.G.H12 TaxID=3120824 RepID=UPI002FD42BD0
MYFSTRQIPALKSYSLAQRMQIINSAAKMLTVPEKTLLNVLKLLVIVPVFVFIIRTSANWHSLLWAFLVFLLYPLIIKPIQYSLCAKYVPRVLSKERK